MASITVAEQDVFPPRVLITVSGLIAISASVITLYREVAGERVVVRGADSIPTGGQDDFVRIDAELPFGIPVRWIAEIDDGASELTSSPLTVNIDKVAISDAINGNAAEVVIIAWPEKTSTRQATVYVPGGRNVVVSGPRPGFRSTIEILTDSNSSRESFMDLLEHATSGILQIRQPGGYGGVDSYVAVISDTERRWSQDGSDPRRRWLLDVVETDGWSPVLVARGFTLEDISNFFGDITLAEFEDEYAASSTLLTIAQGEYA